MLNPSAIKQIIKENNLHINKRLGQNFLINKNIADKMITLCRFEKDDIVLEIGPGLGALTQTLAEQCGFLVAVEKDRGFAKFLEGLFAGREKIRIINDDILKYDIEALYKKHKRKIKVIGNLPYYISSPIIFYLLEHKQFVDPIYITIQKEVAQRIVAKPGNKNYGLLSCSVGYHCTPEILTHISRGSFFPMPEVDSSFLKLSILKEPAVKVENEELFFGIMRSAFNYRRKTFFNALMQSPKLEIDKDALRHAFDILNLDYRIRGEALGLADFARVCDKIKWEVSLFK